ncbi:MAG: hypothetical protein GC153_04420 [Alphaproteobacteria bacterium]|nr:hypothetical protein [Alphaproteobacteria bacterium]
MAHDVKAILTLLDRPGDMAGVLAWANRLARDFDATADAVFMRHDWLTEMPMVSDGFGIYYTDVVTRELQEAAERAEQVAREEFETAQKRGTHCRLAKLHAVSRASRDDLARLARCFDLGVAHLPAEANFAADEAVLGQFLLKGGTPVFVAPRDVRADAPLSSALIAWDGSIEAARAVRAALPFLRDCGQVSIRTIAEKKDEHPNLAPVRRYLELHGVETQPGALKSEGEAVAEKILSEAEEIAASFLVMGAFSSAPWQEQLFGGATHTVLRKSRRPVILSH